ncbi:MAG: hypothetical protein AAFZ49_18930, partial [Cyanobacteria bacterium J06659_2]
KLNNLLNNPLLGGVPAGRGGLRSHAFLRPGAKFSAFGARRAGWVAILALPTNPPRCPSQANLVGV